MFTVPCELGDLVLKLFKFATCAALPAPRWLLVSDVMPPAANHTATETADERVLTVHVVNEVDHAVSSEDQEERAMNELERVVEGDLCLVGGHHSWHTYDGQRGCGRACSRCFTVQQAEGPSGEDAFTTVWQISLTLDPHVPPSARVILALWREEARRCRAGGCIAGGEHVWTDASRTLVRLSVGARCCERCGLVEMSETNQPIVLPNLLGQFGAPVGAELGGAERAWLSEALATGEAEMRRLHASYAPSRESTGVIEAAPFASLDPCARDVPLTSRTGKARFAAHTAYAIRIDHTCSTRLASQSPTSSASASEYAPFAQEVHRFNLPSRQARYKLPAP